MLILASFLVVLGLTLGIWAVIRASDSGTRHGNTTTSVPLAVPTGAGPELPLTVVPIPDRVSREFVYAHEAASSDHPHIHTLFDGSHPLAVRPGDGPSVLLTQEISSINPTAGLPIYCLSLSQSETSESMACDPNGTLGFAQYATPITAPLDRTSPPPVPTSALYMWSDLPTGTAYVTFRSNDLTAWQRPIESSVVFPVPTGLVDATASAYDTDGRLLQQVIFEKVYNTARFVPPRGP
jgi:hypothetical protein